MENRFDHALQVKVTLKGISPPIWRRVQVPCTYTFWDLHVAIQDAMGWLDCHLHLFRLRDSVSGKDFLVGIPDDGGLVDDLEILAGWDIPVVLYLSLAGRAVTWDRIAADPGNVPVSGWTRTFSKSVSSPTLRIPMTWNRGIRSESVSSAACKKPKNAAGLQCPCRGAVGHRRGGSLV